MRLNGYLDTLCWSQAELSRRARVSSQSISRALSGEKVSRRVASAIVQAISEEVGRKLTLNDVEGLQVVTLRRRRKVAPQATQAPTDKQKKPEKQN
jgi:transcriptional regulator with XRE-family HTH domain